MKDRGVLLPHKLLHKFLVLFFYEVFAALYEAVQGDVDNLEGGCAAPLSGHNSTKKRNIPVGYKCCTAVLCFSQTCVHCLPTYRDVKPAAKQLEMQMCAVCCRFMKRMQPCAA